MNTKEFEQFYNTDPSLGNLHHKSLPSIKTEQTVNSELLILMGLVAENFSE